MNTRRYIELGEISKYFRIDLEVCRRFAEFGLIQIVEEDNTPYVEREEIATLQHAVSLYRDLGVNSEGIEVILSMRENIVRLQDEVDRLTRKLERMEGEFIQQNVERPRMRGLFFEL